ncbi:MAG: molybdenum cofactor guanylyltransferase [Solirubrobacteraceae bacterium]
MLACVEDSGHAPVGVILAGGRGSRIGGDKALVELGGRPLVEWVVEALRGAVEEVCLVAKPATVLPPLPGVTVWREPEEPQHPLVGIVTALAAVGGRAVLVCPADMPFVAVPTVRALCTRSAEGAPALIATCEGRLQPLLGRYEPEALALLEPTARQGTAALRDVVSAMRPARLAVDDPVELFNVNTAEDLARARAILAGEGRSDR